MGAAMLTETLLFPIGPVDIPGAPPCGVMISVPGTEVQTVWAEDWDEAFAAAAETLGHDDWHVPTRAEILSKHTAGRARDIGPAHAIRLARLVGDLADPVGFRGLTDDLACYGLMRGMAEFAHTAPGLKMDRTQPVHLEFSQDGDVSMLAGAIGRDGEGAHIYLVQNPDALRTLMETSYGSELGTGVIFIMARVAPAAGATQSAAEWQDGIGAATDLLFGTPFRPMIRTRAETGEWMLPDAFMLRALTLALFRASGIAQGADVVDGEISLHDGTYATIMERTTL